MIAAAVTCPCCGHKGHVAIASDGDALVRLLLSLPASTLTVLAARIAYLQSAEVAKGGEA